MRSHLDLPALGAEVPEALPAVPVNSSPAPVRTEGVAATSLLLIAAVAVGTYLLLRALRSPSS